VFTVDKEKVRTEIAIRGIKSDKEQQQASSYKLQHGTGPRTSSTVLANSGLARALPPHPDPFLPRCSL